MADAAAPAAELPPHLARWAGDVVLSDGGTVHVRPILPTDAPLVEALHNRLSAETVYLRFFSPLPRLPPALLQRFTVVDYDDRFALIALLGDEAVAVARYDRLLEDEAAAEVAFTVDDAHQGRGLGSLLLEQLAAIAPEHGIHRFVAETLPGNDRMLRVFRDAGFGDERRFADGVVQVAFPIEPTEASLAVQFERERRAAARSVARILRPRAVAVIGASSRVGSVGHAVLTNLLGAGFTGPVHPVHPTARSVHGVRAWPSVLDVPDDVDLAVVAVPRDEVLGVVEQCAAKRVAGVAIIATGFREASADGAALERRIVERARRAGMRVVGPASLGLANTDPSVALHAHVGPTRPGAGRVGFASQSGALGIAIMDELARVGLGVSTFVSLGNRADLSANDLLDYWSEDPGTGVVLLHLERFGNPRRFARTARRLSRTTPVVALKTNRFTTKPGSEPAGSLAVGSEAAVEALFAQAGVLRVDTFDQLFSAARALATQPLPAGCRVAVVGNGGGSTLAAVDALLAQDLDVGDPHELAAEATPEAYRDAVATALADPGVDAVLATFLPPLEDRTAEVAAAVAEAAALVPAKPVVGLFVVRGIDREARHGSRVVPLYRFPESAALGLSALARCGEHQRRPEGEVPDLPGLDLDAARSVASAALAVRPGGSWLDRADAADLLAHVGIAVGVPEAEAAAEGRDGQPAVVAAVGLVHDPSFGPLVALRVGERHPAHRILPLTDVDVDELLAVAAPGLHPGRLAGLRSLLLRLGHLAEEVPEVAEVVLEPVVVGADEGAAPAAAAVRVAPADPRPELALRRLR